MAGEPVWHAPAFRQPMMVFPWAAQDSRATAGART